MKNLSIVTPRILQLLKTFQKLGKSYKVQSWDYRKQDNTRDTTTLFCLTQCNYSLLDL